MKIAVVTSIFGNTPLHDPKPFNGVDYVAFVDEPKPNISVWKQISLPRFSSSQHFTDRRNAKLAKILPQVLLPNYDYWIWTDPTHEAITDPKEICTLLGNKSIGVFNHTHRDCSYDEIDILKSLKYEDPDLLLEHEYFLKDAFFPKKAGLYELPVIVRKNSVESLTLGLKWWEIICKYSSRDQISLPYVLWSLNITPYIYSGYANNGLYQNKYLPQVRVKGT